jgi:polyisoprenoid-binding protein YceI
MIRNILAEWKAGSAERGRGGRHPVKMRLAAAVLLLAGAPALAGEIRGGCEFRFLATSTLHDFAGTGRCLPFSAPLVRDAEGGERISLVEIEVPVAEMTTGVGARDRKMREMFEVGRYPVIRASARDVDVDALLRVMEGDAEANAPLEITLAIRGVERTAAATVSRLKSEGNRVTFDIAFPVSLEGFGLRAPSFLGIVRVGDQVAVSGSFGLHVTPDP